MIEEFNKGPLPDPLWRAAEEKWKNASQKSRDARLGELNSREVEDLSDAEVKEALFLSGFTLEEIQRSDDKILHMIAKKLGQIH